MDHFPTFNFCNVWNLQYLKGAGQQERERESHYAMSHHCVCTAEVIRFGSMGFFFFFGGGSIFCSVAKMVMILQEYLAKFGNKLNLKIKAFLNIIFFGYLL
jgi:hypothetical protein